MFHSLLIMMNFSLKEVSFENHWTLMDLSFCQVMSFQGGP